VEKLAHPPAELPQVAEEVAALDGQNAAPAKVRHSPETSEFLS
jgi:hypothetical protein